MITSGPLCKTVEDAALMLNAIAGYDEQDPTTTNTPVSEYSRAVKNRGGTTGPVFRRFRG